MKKRVTPDYITDLRENEIFVFGSNLEGSHGGGAARTAHKKFGAIWGQGVGLQGQSYGIPTMHGGIAEIKPYVDEVIEFRPTATLPFGNPYRMRNSRSRPDIAPFLPMQKR